MLDRKILLIDADAFYVAVARMLDPEGAGKAPPSGGYDGESVLAGVSSCIGIPPPTRTGNSQETIGLSAPCLLTKLSKPNSILFGCISIDKWNG